MTPTEKAIVEARSIINATPVQLFTFWSTPSSLIACFNLARAEMDIRPGGKWLWDWANDPCFGSFIEVEEPNRLVFTWNGKDSEGRSTGDSRIELSFLETSNGQSEVVLIHELPDPGLIPDYTRGWNGSLAAIKRTLEAVDGSG